MLRSLIVAMLAIGAALCYATSNVIEQRKASSAPPESSMRIALLWHLAHQPLWWLGVAVDIGGFVFQVLALRYGTLIFVQPLLVTSLLFSLMIGAAVGAHKLLRHEVVWALVLIAALTSFLLKGSPEGGLDQRPIGAWAMPLAAVAAIIFSLEVMARRTNGAAKAALLGAAAGTTFGVSSTLMKSFAHLIGEHGAFGVLAHWEPYALFFVVAMGFLFVQSAFQAGDLRSALPALEVSEPIVASVLGVGLMREHIDADSFGTKFALVAAVALMLWSALVLARSAAEVRQEMQPAS